MGNVLICIGFLVLFIAGTRPLPMYLAKLLEDRIPKGIINEKIEGIIVLTGSVYMKSSRPEQIELGDSAERIIEGILLAGKYPGAKLAIVGGSGSLIEGCNLREADFLKKLAVDFGVGEDRIITERDSRNTHEGAVELARTVPDSQSGRWVLVTTAYHMPRSYGCYMKSGINVVPYPVDYKTILDKYNIVSFSAFIPKLSNLMLSQCVTHEWIGLIAYRLAGYTDSFLPGVQD
ncbi:YdcF family protein [Candidatus Auribacterota bacterium]